MIELLPYSLGDVLLVVVMAIFYHLIFWDALND